MKIAFTVLYLAVLSEYALACMYNPLSGVAENAVEHVNQSEFVFVGKVLLYEPLEVSEEVLDVIRSESGHEAAEHFLQHSRRYMATKFAVEDVWKGDIADSFVALNDISHSCSFSLTTGDQYVVFSSRTELGNVISVVVLEDEIKLARETLSR